MESFPTGDAENGFVEPNMEAAGIEPARHSPRRTPFQQRCVDAWRADKTMGFEFSVAVLRESHEILKTSSTGVYVVHDVTADRIKIGHSRDPIVRLASLAVGNSNPLELAVSTPGTVGLEKLIHRLLKEQRVSGEWFSITPYALVICELLISVNDYVRDFKSQGEVFTAADTVAILCDEANHLLDDYLRHVRESREAAA